MVKSNKTRGRRIREKEVDKNRKDTLYFQKLDRLQKLCYIVTGL